MTAVKVVSSRRADYAVASALARSRAALAIAGAEVGDADGGARLIVDPAGWFSRTSRAPALLHGAVGLSVAAYGSVALQDDAEVGRHLQAVVHADPRCVDHLRRVGVRAVHAPAGLGAAPARARRDIDVLTLGPATARRLAVLARSAGCVDDVRCRHLVHDLHDDAPIDLDIDATVVADLAGVPGAAADPWLLADVLEAGAMLVTERCGGWPRAAREAIVETAAATVLMRARDIVRQGSEATRLVREAAAAFAGDAPLLGLGTTLATLLAEVPAPAPRRPPDIALSATAPPVPAPRTITQTVREEATIPDAPVRAALLRALTQLNRIEGRLRSADGDTATDAAPRVLQAAANTSAAPEVSVLIPAHGAAATLAETLDSVLATAREGVAVEAIVVDDASPSGDAQLAQEWSAGHPELPVTVLSHATNRGLSAARNTAVAHARAALVVPLDADDRLRPHGLARLLAGLRRDPEAAFAWGIMARFDHAGPTGIVGMYAWDPARFRTGNYIPALALIRRDVLEELGGYNDMPWGYEDWDLWCRYATSGRHGIWVPEIVADYRTRPESMSAGLHLSLLAPLADMLDRHPTLLA